MMNAPRRLLAVSESQRIDRLFNDVLTQLKFAFQSEASMLALVDHERGELVSRSKTEGIPDFRSSIDEGIMGRVARTGTAELINDIQQDPEYSPDRYQDYKGTGITVRSVLCHPVFDSNRKVIAVIEILNKGNSKFDEKDNNLLRTIASHIALNLEGQGSSLKKVLRIVKDQYLAAGLGDKQEIKLQEGRVGLLEPARVVCYVREAQGLDVGRVAEIVKKLFNRAIGAPQSYLTLEVVIGDPKRGKDRPADGRLIKSEVSSGANPEFDQNLIVEVPAGQKVYCVLKLWRKSFIGASKLVGEISRSVDGLRQGSEPVIQEVYLTGINGQPSNTKVLVNWSVIAMPI
jgi:putative methionine-R-sulfoxide reductase with GAF domain